MPANARIPIACVALLMAGAAAAWVWLNPRPQPALGWPAVFGPTEDSYSNERIDLGRIAKHGPAIKWRRPVGLGYSSPVTADGRVIVQHRVNPPPVTAPDKPAALEDTIEQNDEQADEQAAASTPGEEVIACFDLETGQPLWEHRYPTTYHCEFEYSDGPYATPRIHQGSVYTLGAQWQARRLDLETGNVIWQRDLSKDYEVEQGLFGFGPGTVIDGDRLIFNLGAADAGVVALDTATGQTVWASGRDRMGYTTPRLATVHGKRYAMVLTFEGLQALDPATGEQRFFFPFTNKVPLSVAATSPVVWGDRVLLVTGPGPGAVCLRVLPDGSGCEEVWRDRRAIDSQWNTLMRVGGVLYGFTSKRRTTSFRAVDLEQGEVLWSWTTELERGTALRSRRAMVLWGEHGHLAFLDIDPDEPSPRWASDGPLLATPTYSSPALDSGLLLLRNEGTLMCLSLRGEDLTNPALPHVPGGPPTLQ